MVGQFLIAQAGTNLNVSAPSPPARLGHAMIRPRQAEKIVDVIIVVLVLDLILTGAIPKWACSRRSSCRC